MILIDAHCHLEAKDFPTPETVIDRAKEAGLRHAIVVGLMQRPGDFGRAIEVAAAHPNFLTPTMGIHPHDAAAVGVRGDPPLLGRAHVEHDQRAVAPGQAFHEGAGRDAGDVRRAGGEGREREARRQQVSAHALSPRARK